ncbi:MAG: diguanylate cyclase [Acidimicrobiales bacterium]
MTLLERDADPAAASRPDATSSLLERVGLATSRAYGHFSVLLHPDFSVMWGSETLGSIFGWADPVGRNIVELIHPDDLELVLAAMDYHSEHAEEYRSFDATWRPDVSTIRVAHANGDWVRCEVSVFNHLGDPAVDALLATGRIADDRTDLPLAIDLLGSGAGLDAVLPVIARLVDRTIDGVRCQVMWWDHGFDHVISAPDAPEPPAAPMDMVAEVRRSGEMATVTDLEGEYPAVWVLPIVAPGGPEVVGCLVAWSPLAVPLVTGPQQPIHQALRLASLAIVDHHAKAALRWEASHDGLTGLANRAGFHREVSAVASSCALLYVDLDDFKVINDRLGHQAGDAVLVEVARRIRGVVRDGDTVGRLGGDEFAVVCPGLADEELAVDIARRLIESVCLPISVGGQPTNVGASVGVAMGRGTADGMSLIRRADEALYRAKDLGKRRVVVSHQV